MSRRGTGSGGLSVLMARTLLACVSLFASGVWVSSAHADDETVLLMVPQTPEPALVELFHRVEAELRLHQFRPQVLVAPLGDSTESLLGAQASAQRAFAAIAIAEEAQSAMLFVWIVDSRTGLTRQYRVTQQGGEEPVNVVAVRAIDLLRANRVASPPPPSAAREHTPGRAVTAGPSSTTAAASERSPQPQAAEQQPAQAPPASAAAAGGSAARARPAEHAGRASARKRPAASAPAADGDETEDREAIVFEDTSPPTITRYKPTLLQIASEVVGLSLSRRLGWSFGPSISAWLTLGERLRVGVVGVAPLRGAELRAPLGEPTIRQELVWIEVGVMLLRAGPLQLSAAGGGGLHWLQARGHAVEPYRPNDASLWSWTASLATRADVMLTQHWSLGLTVRARMFLPPVEVAAQTESARLATPAVEGALGLSLWL